MSTTSASRKSRSAFRVGTVIHWRDFPGASETKSRFFVIVGTTDTCFLCFTTTTKTHLLQHPKLAASFTEAIPAGSCCLPRECRVDCRNCEEFDDVLMSNYLGSGRVTVVGMLPAGILASIQTTASQSRTLERAKKALILAELDAAIRQLTSGRLPEPPRPA